MANTVTLFKKLMLSMACALTTIASAAPAPNIVLIISDDQAWTDYGFMGHPAIRTPHLDRLADHSLVFERGYVAAPICRPSLASMVTGRFPFAHGVTGNDVVEGVRGLDREVLDKPLRDAFHRQPSFIRLLTENGYLAHQSGKWWEGSWEDGGFTDGMTRGQRHGDAGLRIGREGMKPVTDFIDHALDEGKPFFVWYAPFLPHAPHNPPARLLAKYREEGRAEDVANYYAMCEWFDETCGALLGHLEARDLTENTLVLYVCDNGWVPASTTRDWSEGERWPGYAMRSKASPYENGIRTPILVSWPGRLEPERVSGLAHSLDLFPTIAAAAGLDPPVDLPGINLLDRQAVRAHQAVFGVCHASHNITIGDPDDTLQYLWCVDGDWKLLVRYHGKDTSHYSVLHAWDTAPVRLYNLKDDPREEKDLAASRPDVVEGLRRKIERWHPVRGAAAVPATGP